MLTKADILSDSDLQLRVIQHYYSQAQASGKFFKIRNEKTPSARLRLYKGVWYLKDFGMPGKPLDCFEIVKENESCDFHQAIASINKLNFTARPDDKHGFDSRDTKPTDVGRQLNAICKNGKEKATAYLKSRAIDVENLPENAYCYDKFRDAVVFSDSEKKVLNRRLIHPAMGKSKARMTKYSGFDPLYDLLYDKRKKRVYLTEGVINSLSLTGYSAISVFTTSNLIRNPEKLRKYIEGKEVVIAFDNDGAGNECSNYYVRFIQESGILVKTVSRLLLPEKVDINDLLVEGILDDFLSDKNHFKTFKNTKTEIRSEQKKKNGINESSQLNLNRNQQIEHFIDERYDVRYNAIKQQPEYRIRTKERLFRPVDRYVLNSFKRELNQNGINSSADNLRSILESDFSPQVHPVQQYFNDLPPWDQEDHISSLASTVLVENKELWYQYLKKWLVAVVANVLNTVGCQNHTCLVITGKQGAFKTTWLDNLCPKDLNQYLFTGKIDPQNKDSLTYIAECFLINIDDQLRQLNKRDENELKNLITTPFVKYRRPYDVYVTEYPHTASFMASVNGNDFLTDPTGSRRFLPFEALEIKIDDAKKVDIDMVYAQALHLFYDGFVYWFDRNEIEALHKHNEAFQVQSIEEQLILEYFDVPDSRDSATDFLQSAMIKKYIEEFTRSNLSLKKLGEALTRLGFEKWQRTRSGRTKWVWSVIKKEYTQVEQQNK
jgi:predicted P-loop ATPase